MSGSLDRYRTMESEDLASAYRELGGLVRAAEAQRLQMLAVLAEREAYRADGCIDAAQWVAATDMVEPAAAKAAVETARALTELPAITAAAEEGRLSMAQLVPLAVIAEPSPGADSDERWAADGPATPPGALAARARQKRRVEREDRERQQRRRSIRWWNDRHGLGVRFAGLLPDDAAAVVTGAIESRAEDLPRNEQGLYDPHDIRCADALVELSAEALGDAGRPEVVVHVPVGVEKLAPTLADGTPVSIDVIRRLACDATARLVVDNPDGTVAGYGRRRRIVPDKMREHLRQRDRCCRWDGCHRTRGLRAHHIDHWVADGETEERNCVLLCRTHHALVHEGGWTISGDPGTNDLRFHRPACGTTIPVAPTPADPELRKRYGLGDAA